MGPLSVSSGHTATHGLNVANSGDAELLINTNGNLIADVIDPASGRIVGGYTGAQYDMLTMFRIPPATTVRVPLLVGTASFEPQLGYAVPPGAWALRCTLELGDGRTFGTPLLPFTITR